MIADAAWRWFGHPGHLIVASECRFHLCTQIGDYLISTVGEWFPDEPVREIFAQSRGITLTGRGDARRADYLKKVGFEPVGAERLFETMVFRTIGTVCEDPACGCGLPQIDPTELDMQGYNTAGAATIGHLDLCRKWSGV